MIEKKLAGSESERKVSPLEQIIFDVRFGIKYLIASLRVNISNFSVANNFEESKNFFQKLEKLETIEFQTSRKINELLEKFGTKFEVGGIENVPSRPVIFPARHESWWDTTGLQNILRDFVGRKHPTKYLAKKELFGIPVFGKALSQASHISFDREGKWSGFRKEIKSTLEKLKRDVIVFIEGTRKKRGVLAPAVENCYRKSAMLAKLRTPLVPVFIRSHQLRKDEFYKNP